MNTTDNILSIEALKSAIDSITPEQIQQLIKEDRQIIADSAKRIKYSISHMD